MVQYATEYEIKKPRLESSLVAFQSVHSRIPCVRLHDQVQMTTEFCLDGLVRCDVSTYSEMSGVEKSDALEELL